MGQIWKNPMFACRILEILGISVLVSDFRTVPRKTEMNSTSFDQAPHEVAAYLQKQNFYQRLGFSSVVVSSEQIRQAYSDRTDLLLKWAHEMTKEELEQVKTLLDEAFNCLSNRKTRAKYVASLYSQEGSEQSVQEPAHLLNRYKLGEPICRGDRSMVFLARDTRLNRDVVIKRIQDERGNDDRLFQQIREEAELFAGNNSVNLVKILDFDLATGSIVLEKMAGDLRTVFKPNGVPAKLVQDIVEQALRGIESLHNLGIAHGRIDMSHLLLDDFNRVKLSVTPGLMKGSTALRPGTHSVHVAPEMLNASVFGEPKLGIDVYALGFIALELLVGKSFAKKVDPGIAFKGANLQSWLLWHASANDHLPSVKELVPELGDSFAAVLEKMTRKNQAERYTNASDCLADLRVSPQQSKAISSAPEGIDLESIQLGDAPPQLQGCYQEESAVGWNAIARNPRLLMKPQYRTHTLTLATVIVGLGSLVILAGGGAIPNEPKSQARAEENAADILANPFDLASFPTPPEWNEQKTGELAQEVIEPKKPPEESLKNNERSIPQVWQVRFDVSGGGKVLAVDESQLSANNGDWPLPEGTHTVRYFSKSLNAEYEIEIDLPMGSGRMAYAIQPAPTMTDKPLPVSSDDQNADIRFSSFRPIQQAIPIAGASSVEKAERFAAILNEIYRNVARTPNNTSSSSRPFVLPNSPVDPRFAFALALLAQQRNDTEQAKALCSRALEDAKSFRIAFLPALQLLNHIQLREGDLAAALTECRTMLSWLSNEGLGIDVDSNNVCTQELAWWTGLMIGFGEEATKTSDSGKVDTNYTIGYFERVCASKEWKAFRIGRLYVTERARQLHRVRDEYLSHRKQLEEDNRIIRANQAEKMNEDLELRRYFGNSRRRLVHTMNSTKSVYPYNESELDNKLIVHTLGHSYGPNPRTFTSYVPNDITVFAGRSIESIVVPSAHYFASTRR